MRGEVGPNGNQHIDIGMKMSKDINGDGSSKSSPVLWLNHVPPSLEKMIS